MINNKCILFFGFIILIIIFSCGDEKYEAFKCNEESYFCCSDNICTAISSIGEDGNAVVILEPWEVESDNHTLEWYEGDTFLGTGELVVTLLSEGEHEIQLRKNNEINSIDKINIWINDLKRYYRYFDEGVEYYTMELDRLYLGSINELTERPTFTSIGLQQIISSDSEIINQFTSSDFISFSFICITRSCMIPENKFTCKFNSDVNEEWINQFNEKNHIDKMERAPLTDTTEQMFTLTVKHRNGLATLFIANLYHSNNNIIYTVPFGTVAYID